jgi:hypothetical protein
MSFFAAPGRENAMPAFIAAGPFDVPLQQRIKRAKLIDRAAARTLTSQSDGFLRHGCYVFGVRAGRGARPIYVGMTKSQNLITEAFNDKNVNRVNEYINRQKGNPVLYIVYQKAGRGNPAKNCHPEIEEFLVTRCAKRNPKLINVHMNKKAPWSITGVVNAGSGKPSAAAARFSRLIGS